MNTRSAALSVTLVFVFAFTGCAKKNEATESAPSPVASPVSTTSVAPKEPATAAVQATQDAPEEDPSWPALTGEKSLRERLLGAWEPQHPPKLDARIKEEFNRADDRINSAPTVSDREAAKLAKAVLEEIASTSLEFTQTERIARAAKGKLRSRRTYEVVTEQGRTITIRVREKGKERTSGELERYTFRDDDTMSTERDEVDALDVFVRRRAPH